MKTFVYLLATTLAAAIILLLIFHSGNIPNRHDNGFKRTYLPPVYSTAQEIQLRDTLHELVGATAWNIYMTTSTEGEVLETGVNPPHRSTRIKIPFFRKFYDSLQFSSLSIKIDSPLIYLFAENEPAIVKTSFDSSIFDIRILPPGPFTREAMADTGCFILRKLDPSITDQLFVRYSFHSGQLKKEDNISQVYGDGGILTDGQLHFDTATKKLYYIYYYRNLLLSFDTSLNTVNTFSSIDTSRSFTMRTGLVTSNGITAYTNTTPANMINQANFVAGGLLFNMSTLRADNDTDKFFAGHSILDIIDLRNGKYLGSLRFPLVRQNKLSRFIVSDNKLIGLYPTNIMIYDLAPAHLYQ